MNLYAVHHEARSRYAYAYDPQTIHLRLRTGRGDVEAVTLVGGDAFCWVQNADDPSRWEWDKAAAFHETMQLEHSTDLFDYWFVAVRPRWLRLRYAFILQSGETTLLYGSHGFYDLKRVPHAQYEISQFFNFPYLNAEDVFTAPAWAAETVWYQIFPDRFADGDAGSNPPGWLPWGSDQHSDIHALFGGDLQGILDHLDDLQALGINGLYLTPIFESPSSHKYDTTNYYRIDPAFGDNELFAHLVQAAHQRGIRIMLDAVFNHCGWFHPFWQDVVRRGRNSPYYECFFIEREPVINFDVQPGQLPRLTAAQRHQLNYRTFAFAPNMPKWNTAHPLVKEHLLGAIRYWTALGVDGWRLDVSNEIAHTFWREFRQLAQSLNPHIYILGENWDNSYPWLMGDQFHGVMNYEFTYAVWNLLRGSDALGQPFGVQDYRNAVSQYLVSYPKNVLPSMYNLVDSHDTPRIRHICQGNSDAVRLAYLLQMSFPGAPSIYYGSEIGLDGDGGHNRAPMPWQASQQDLALRDFIRRLIELRRAHPAFAAVDLRWVYSNPQDNTLIFAKTAAGETLYVLLNVSDRPHSLKLPTGAQSWDLLAECAVPSGETFELAPFGFRLLLVA